MSRHTLIVRYQNAHPRSAGLLADAQALGLKRVERIICEELYFVEGNLTEPDLQCLAAELLSDPVAQTFEWRSVDGAQKPGLTPRPGFSIIETALRPGVTDPVADQVVRSAHVRGFTGVTSAATGSRFLIQGRLKQSDLHRLARRLLANPVIQQYQIGQIEPPPLKTSDATRRAELIPVRGLGPDELLALSQERRAALDPAELRAVQAYYEIEGRDPTDVEFEMIAQTWSEHCSHKTFKARITLHGPPTTTREIDGLLKTYLRAATESIAAPWVRSAFVDNAGILDFGDGYDVSFKVETHNHPSAIEPFGGANTGVGGVIRDILGVSAKPIAATDVLCFGPADLDPRAVPEGVLHPRRIRSGVVAGVQDYGNKIGLPTVNGAILYDPGYTANPLVFCGCVGLAPAGKHAALREPRPGDRVILLGGRTGRDGLRGATFSSMTMDSQTGEVAGASVQIGDPITEKGLIEVIVRARDQGYYHALTDCGAGGLSSAVGEMAAECGCEVELANVRLKYAGLAPWEIWLSEAQERMVLAAPEAAVADLQALCDTFDVELTDIGAMTGTGRIIVRCESQVVVDLAGSFLQHGNPQRQLAATIPRPAECDAEESGQGPKRRQLEAGDRLLKLLSDPNVASKADVIRRYDHEVQGGTVVKPLTGKFNDGPSDGCVLRPLGTSGHWGLVLANGINPELGKTDPYAMALNVMDEAIRNAVAVGADPERIAVLDNFCWGDPRRPETLGALVEAARGCCDAALHYRTPFISGKDSLNNEYLGPDGARHAIPPTLLISAIGRIEDIQKAVTLDLKEPGNSVYLAGWIQGLRRALPDATLYPALHRAMAAGLVRACHDLSDGGLAGAAAEMCIAGRLGLSITSDADIFAETNGCMLVEIEPRNAAAFESMLIGQALRRLGVVTEAGRLNISSSSRMLISIPVARLVSAWMGADLTRSSRRRL